jgi:hypothetical protein
MTYPVNGSIPGPNQLLSQSQGDIQVNFANIIGWSAVDHIEYGAVNAGTHEQVTIITPQSAPTATSAEGVITTQTVTNSELFFTNASKNIQITNSSFAPASGQGYLPGGLQIRASSGTANNANIAFSPVFPTALLSVVATIVSSAATNLQITAQSKNGFSASGPGSPTINWIAIGY